MKMKFFKLHRYFGILLIIILCATSGNAQKTERTIEKTFPINPDGKLTLDNSYGNLTLNQWDKNEVHIRVNISVEGADRDPKLHKKWEFMIYRSRGFFVG